MVLNEPAGNPAIAASYRTLLSRSASARIERIASLADAPSRSYAPVLEDGVQRAARPADPALHGAHGAAADFGGLLVGEAAGADQDQRFALFGGQHGQALAQLVQRHGRLGIVHRHQGAFGRLLVELALPPGAALLGIELVAQDHEGPGLHVGAHLEAGARVPGLHHGVLRQVVGRGRIAAQGAGEGAQMRDQLHQLTLERRIVAGGRGGRTFSRPRLHQAFSADRVRRRCRRMSRNSSGTSSFTTSSNI